MREIVRVSSLILLMLSTCLGISNTKQVINENDNFNINSQKKTKKYETNPLELYSKVTSLTMAFNSRYGKKAMIPKNAQDSLNLILKNSNIKEYMGSKDYNGYSKNSKFYKRAQAMMSDLENLIVEFKKIGFIDEIKSQGKTPGIMIDIDNTIELTSFEDDINTKSGIDDPATKKFIKDVCFKDGIACYFITARTCNKNEALNTEEWLEKNIGLSKEQVSKYVFLSGAIHNNACAFNPNNSI
ncbi:hypothetical protein [Francisella sp. 19X1-34]|uniref:hypothetical protein n=1 Tax=Francisella sp. 19X1-34 TaxID=3087177 RepID=UPI002E3386EB|nr:hypothetical protein [Francisella sp. 19X1-34]MED7789497.1 hypothetical protein [Francisella sp. 19X1-34]